MGFYYALAMNRHHAFTTKHSLTQSFRSGIRAAPFFIQKTKQSLEEFNHEHIR